MNSAEQWLQKADEKYKKGDLDGAIAALRNVQRDALPNIYARAQINLGVALKEQDDIDSAIEAYRNIQYEDSPEIYNQAQLYLGIALSYQGKLAEAKVVFDNVQCEISEEIYAAAQFYLGVNLGNQNKLDEAENVFRNIQREASSKIYAMSQLFLGLTLNEKGEKDKAKAVLSNIQREDLMIAYSQARLLLGEISLEQGKVEESIVFFNEISCNDIKQVYIKSRVNLGDVFWEKGDIEEARKIYEDILNVKYFEAKSALLSLRCKEKLHEDLMGIRKIIMELMKNLLVFYKNLFEFKVAHYTKSSTVWKMIEEEKPSLFRLNTIKNVNDPTEGVILSQYLQKSCGVFYEFLSNDTKNIENPFDIVFVSCFTFNHDSLNQFRLYGKEEEREASGVSLVFANKFFNLDYYDSLDFIASNNNRFVDESSKECLNNKGEKLLNKQSLYRCIYIDPDTGYLSLARRDHVTFYREILANNPTQNLNQLCVEAQAKWIEYQEEISKKEKVIQGNFEKISKHLQNLEEVFREEEVFQEEKLQIFEALNFIFLPIKYLVKHAAFQEEQECRIIYLTDLSDEKIKMDWDIKQMYIEYEPRVNKSIDKIYLSPGARAHEDFFRRALVDNGAKKKVRISSNPFRTK